jgi:hypothetical protein
LSFHLIALLKNHSPKVELQSHSELITIRLIQICYTTEPILSSVVSRRRFFFKREVLQTAPEADHPARVPSSGSGTASAGGTI